MKSFFKNNLFAVLVTVLAYALSSPASAQTKTSFPSLSGVTITGVAAFGGAATTNFAGQGGFGRVGQQGNGKMDIVISGTGNGCLPSNCGGTTYSVNGQAKQTVNSVGGAWAKQPGTVGISSLGRAEAAVGVTVTPAGQ